MTLATFFVQCLNSMQYGLLLFLVASGLTLVFGIMGIVNLAHGSFYMIGAYLAYSLTALTGNLFVALTLGLVLSLIFGYLLEWVFFSFLYERDHLQQVLMTYGLILVIEELRSILIGDDVHSVAMPAFLAGSISIGNDMLYPVYRLFVSAACLVLAFALYWLIRKTRVGMKIRAGASNREMAQSLGIDIGLLYRVVFSLGFGLAVMSGMLFAPVSTVYPGMGAQMLIVCFLVVVIGGIGSITGAFVAALLIGFVDTFGKVLWQEGAGIAIYLLMAAILLVRPAGLLKKG